ncbi:hypothetical protein FA95DRAFT_1197661 [Auriscalpium vulgare]|uniref:Uncharacterized protein n=1 Tax=Auriscalpium vulgare TaxID=40419 RepID=A0ACB8RUT4_9AGAM|nr:hypothetical protein FA95DRAFT_1197661 [Auriscalpium vulgare]
MTGTLLPSDLESDTGVLPTAGALLIGSVISAVLSGVTRYQTSYYFDEFPNDGLDLKIWWPSYRSSTSSRPFPSQPWCTYSSSSTTVTRSTWLTILGLGLYVSYPHLLRTLTDSNAVTIGPNFSCSQWRISHCSVTDVHITRPHP